MKFRLWWLAGDAVAAGALYERAIKAFKANGDYGLDYVRALQGWGSLEAQTRNSTKARYLYVESVRTAQMVILLVFSFLWEIKDFLIVRFVFLNVFHCQNLCVHLKYSAKSETLRSHLWIMHSIPFISSSGPNICTNLYSMLSLIRRNIMPFGSACGPHYFIYLV